MAIINVIPSIECNIDMRPSWISIDTSNLLSEVMQPGYIDATLYPYISWDEKLICLVTTTDKTPVWLATEINDGVITLIATSIVS